MSNSRKRRVKKGYLNNAKTFSSKGGRSQRETLELKKASRRKERRIAKDDIKVEE
jgi:hypothetical protein